MMRNLVLGIGLVLATASRSEAANIAVITAPPNLLQVVILAAAVACLMASVKVLILVRGGQLAKAVQLFVAAFALLTMCQLLVLFGTIEVLSVPSFVPPLMLSGMAALFLYGLMQIRRVLG
jgi:hypothetical protein